MQNRTYNIEIENIRSSIVSFLIGIATAHNNYDLINELTQIHPKDLGQFIIDNFGEDAYSKIALQVERYQLLTTTT